MKEVDTHVDPGLVEKVFSAVMESNTVEKINKLERLLAKNSNFVEALNQTYPDVGNPLNILHNLAVIDHCSAILPYLTKYIDTSLFKQQSHEGKTPIMSAISVGRLDNAKVLVEAQRIALKEKRITKSQVDKEIADTVNIQDDKGQTPLHRAADFHEPKHVEFLIANGANTKILDKDKNCALIYAVSGITSDIIKVNTVVALVKNFQELNIRGSEDKTALEILRETQKITWGSHQEKELMRACDRKSRNTLCVIS